MTVIDDEPCDVAIMGAGAAGALFAARLAWAGKRVVVLEAGKPWELTDLVSSQIWARRLQRGGAPVLPGGSHTIQAEMGISGDAAAEVCRPPGAPYPIEPLMSLKRAEVLKRGFDKLGIRVSPAPMAVNSVEYDGRSPCVYDAWCDAGCPIGARANPLVMHLPATRKAGATLTAHAVLAGAGATDAWVSTQRTFAHVSGGTVMGDDPATSVTDAFGRLHEAANVVAAGGGLFPSIGAVSLTFTVLALADRTAGDMVANWGSYAP